MRSTLLAAVFGLAAPFCVSEDAGAAVSLCAQWATASYPARASAPPGFSVELRGDGRSLPLAWRELHMGSPGFDEVQEDVGWPASGAWYTFPGPAPGTTLQRKSQLGGEAVPPASILPRTAGRGFADTGVRLCAVRDGCAWAVKPTVVESYAGGQRRAYDCLAVDVTHAPAGIGSGAVTVSVVNDCTAAVRVSVDEALPWFIRRAPASTSFHGSGAGNGTLLVRQRSVRRGQPEALTWTLAVPPSSDAHASYRYGAELLHAEELPPNTHHGVQLLPFSVRACWVDGGECASWWLPPLLLELPSPDFSMPYNVITFVSTVLAFAAGSILNALGRKPKRREPAPGGAQHA
jgi:hypothetical protein